MLKVTNLRKEFDTVVAVDDVSFEVQRGELFGLLGPNGAGKTTTIRTILNIIKPNRGEVTFDGKLFSPQTWNTIGYLPEERGLYRKSKVINAILYFAALKGLQAEEAKPRAYRWLKRFSLEDRAHNKVEELSKGNQQKVQLIISLLHDPQLLILDEPFSGLDPVNQILLKDVLMELRKQDVAIIFSTHQMEQVEKMCDNICLINRGKPVLHGGLREIKKQYGKNSVHLEFDGNADFLKNLPFVKHADVYQNYAELELADAGQSNEIFSYLNGKLVLRKFEIVEPSLNSIFISVVGPPRKIEAGSPVVSMALPGRTKQPMDARLKKAFVSLFMAGFGAVAFAIATFTREDPEWSLSALLGAAAAYSAFNVVRVRKKIAAEQKAAAEGKAS